jgi:2-keto-4-pentenoate hydratase
VGVRNLLDSLDYYPMAVEIIDARLAEEPEAEKAEL